MGGKESRVCGDERKGLEVIQCCECVDVDSLFPSLPPCTPLQSDRPESCDHPQYS